MDAIKILTNLYQIYAEQEGVEISLKIERINTDEK